MDIKLILSESVVEDIQRLTSKKAHIGDVIKRAIECYLIMITYQKEGKKLYWKDEQTQEETEVLIPGLYKT